MTLTDIVQDNKTNLAFIIGNGINRFDSPSSNNSWDNLLVELWNKCTSESKSRVPPGIALTEFYDVLELKQRKIAVSSSLQKKFCDLMEDWSPSQHHSAFVQWASKHNSPVLTTNFESTLAQAGECILRRFSSKAFTDYYPWDSYYSIDEIYQPESEFAIWHINGMQRYHRSIRLGLTHYMGSVERARKWFHKGDEGRLFSGKNQRAWDGAFTWLQVIFNTPFVIIGLGLEQGEVFLRWLLIERAKYFARFPDQKKKAWYVHVGVETNLGKQFFLESVGIESVKALSYNELYSDPWGDGS